VRTNPTACNPPEINFPACANLGSIPAYYSQVNMRTTDLMSPVSRRAAPAVHSRSFSAPLRLRRRRKSVGQWEPYEITMTASSELSNPYVETLPDDGTPYVKVAFTGVSGAAKGMRYTITGFWDGGKTFKARFAPPAAGEWSYAASSADAGLAAVKGSFECTAWTDAEKAATPTRHGFVRVAGNGPRAGRYFEYADGTPFLWIGDTWWTWARRASRSIGSSRWWMTVRPRASRSARCSSEPTTASPCWAGPSTNRSGQHP